MGSRLIDDGFVVGFVCLFACFLREDDPVL